MYSAVERPILYKHYIFIGCQHDYIKISKLRDKDNITLVLCVFWLQMHTLHNASLLLAVWRHTFICISRLDTVNSEIKRELFTRFTHVPIFREIKEIHVFKYKSKYANSNSEKCHMIFYWLSGIAVFCGIHVIKYKLPWRTTRYWKKAFCRF